MAKLLKKHLGIGAKKPVPSSPKLDCESPSPQGFEVRSRPNPLTDLHAAAAAAETDSSSTVSSGATDELPPPPGPWTLQQVLGETPQGPGQAFGGARPKDVKPYRPPHVADSADHSKYMDSSSETGESDFVEVPKNLGKRSKDAHHIYENQVMFDPLHKLIDSESLQEVKKWLGEISLGSSSAEATPTAPSDDFRPKMGYDVKQLKADKVRSPRLDMNRKIMALVAENASERKSSAVKDVEDKTGSKPKESEYEKSNPATREPDYERYTRLREELKLELEMQLSEILEEDSVCLSELGAVDRDPAARGGGGLDENPMVRSGGYEEPWDLEVAQGDIEDQFNGVLVGEWILRETPADNDPVAGCSAAQPPVPAVPDGPPPPHELDIRTQTGYEKPWDWKPHLKDGRGPEGYEKPWDWKPHMKDDRPPKEYEEPWDKKAKNIENEVIAAKIAKEAANAGGKDGAPASQVRAPEDAQKPHLKDGRPPNEYEEPWDKKAKDIESDLIAAKIAKEAAKASAAAGEPGPEQPSTSAGIVAAVKRNLKDGRLQLEKDAISNLQKSNQVLRTASEDGGKPIRPFPVSSPVQRHRHMSPKKRSGLTPDLENLPRNRIGERILTRIPLEEQRWYHGTISRGDAESILQGHREGSYLVRHSESGTDEFSLSVKSSRGFMHMKIVVDSDRRFILGQFSQPFTSVPQMIQYYTVSKLPIKGAEHMSLLYPVNRKVL